MTAPLICPYCHPLAVWPVELAAVKGACERHRGDAASARRAVDRLFERYGDELVCLAELDARASSGSVPRPDEDPAAPQRPGPDEGGC